ncbi:hypothetical protein HII13_002575 [Brettanomyces bruxellensis]|nr:hypothetical protein HII13_002575 [Brettanomyces bruxellensis]
MRIIKHNENSVKKTIEYQPEREEFVKHLKPNTFGQQFSPSPREKRNSNISIKELLQPKGPKSIGVLCDVTYHSRKHSHSYSHPGSQPIGGHNHRSSSLRAKSTEITGYSSFNHDRGDAISTFQSRILERSDLIESRKIKKLNMSSKNNEVEESALPARKVLRTEIWEQQCAGETEPKYTNQYTYI